MKAILVLINPNENEEFLIAYALYFASKFDASQITYISFIERNPITVWDVLENANQNESVFLAQKRLEHLKQATERESNNQLTVQYILEEGSTKSGLELFTEQNDVVVLIGEKFYLLDSINYKSIFQPRKTYNPPNLFFAINMRFKTSFENIVYACDLNGISAEEFPIDSFRKVLDDGVKLSILNVDDEYATLKPETIEEQYKLHQYFDKYGAQIIYINGPDPVKECRKFIKKENADLLITIPRKHAIWHKLFHASISRKLTVETQTTVFMIPAI